VRAPDGAAIIQEPTMLRISARRSLTNSAAADLLLTARDVAQKYAGRKDADAMLAARMKGIAPAPAAPDADLELMIHWILATR